MVSAPPLKSQFTSDASKFFLHQEAMESLRAGKGQPIVSHIMLTDRCQHSCAFCSVATRDGGSLTMVQVKEYLDQLVPLGLKAVILSGGGNPILYRDNEKSGIGQHPMLPHRNCDFNDAVDLIKSYGLEIGLITNGMPMKDFQFGEHRNPAGIITPIIRKSWKTVRPETLDKCTWIRISMSGLDHDEREVFVPDIDPSKTTLGFSYVYHDKYIEPEEENHGKVSTIEDIRTPLVDGDGRTELGKDRIPWLTEQLRGYVERHNPVYLRLLPNCLEPSRIPERCAELQVMAEEIDPSIAFVQRKPPKAPDRCFLGYVHPVLNSDGLVFPCDSVCLANAALRGEHKFASPWAICKWNDIADYFSKPVHSMVDSQKLCSGCVFHHSNDVLAAVVDGGESPYPEGNSFTHPNFV